MKMLDLVIFQIIDLGTPMLMRTIYFSPLMNEIECFNYNNFGHNTSECRSNFFKSPRQQIPKQYSNKSGTNIWKQRLDTFEECVFSLYVHNQERKWYVDSWFSKHMNGEKVKVLLLRNDTRGSVTFG